MRSFFRSLERRAVRYLLISGQASVLYGGAEFSEDVDLWVACDRRNFEALHAALRNAGARVHKLTPPLDPLLARRGHGFHFLLPPEGDLPRYLDIMGRPPRVGSFAAARRRATIMRTPLGTMPVAAIADLVELKKTRRLGDYDVISRLALARLSNATSPSRVVLRWCLLNCFRVDDAVRILEGWPAAEALIPEVGRPWLRDLASVWTAGAPLDVESEARLQAALNAEIAEHQRRDIFHWSGIIDELRQMRKTGSLLPEGAEL